MSESNTNVTTLNAVVAQQLDSVEIDLAAVHRAILRASLALLTPEQLADVVISRVHIERAKGLLMQTYRLDADDAFEMLVWWSQATNVKLRVLARRLNEGLATLPVVNCSVGTRTPTASPRRVPPPSGV